MTKSKRLDDLVSSVEDLLARLPDDLTPEVADLRDRVDAGIFEAWTSVARADTEERRSGPRLWTTIGLALFAGATSLFAYRLTRPLVRLAFRG